VRAFYGGRGIWTDKARTAALAPAGVTVGVLHTGRSYADDLLQDGIVYHYPRTTVRGRDVQEVDATKAAKTLGLPVFVVVQPDSSSRRVVHLGWVEDWDDESELFLITFGETRPAEPPRVDEKDEIPFEQGYGRFSR
jgi:putative restriction endonuclease